jgi:hypothetical protein
VLVGTRTASTAAVHVSMPDLHSVKLFGCAQVDVLLVLLLYMSINLNCAALFDCAYYTGDADITADYKWADPVAKVVIAPRSTY